MVNNGQQESQKMIKKSTAKNPKVRAKEYGLVVRKLDNRPNAPYQTDYYANGKRIRRSFKTYEEAVEDYERYISTIGKAQNVLWNRNLSIEQVADVNTALNMLPQGKTLVDAVKYLLGTIQTLPLVDSLYEFRKSKEKCSLDHVRHVKIITKKFLEKFNEWIDINDKSFLEWLLQRGQPKTIYHSYTLMSEFFAYAVRRGHISKHPASNVVSSDLPKVKVKPPKFFTIDETKEILSYMQKQHPHYTLWFAIGFFTGIRHAEINRLTMNNFIIDRKEILLKGDIVKTGDTWLMADLPDNLWEWVKKYEYRSITDSAWKKLTKQMKKDLPHINWHHNGLRHSFATYHLSKYRDASKTSLLLRHRNRETLWQHYLGGLVSEDIANQYFSIVP